jgi:hypothetical protein
MEYMDDEFDGHEETHPLYVIPKVTNLKSEALFPKFIVPPTQSTASKVCNVKSIIRKTISNHAIPPTDEAEFAVVEASHEEDMVMEWDSWQQAVGEPSQLTFSINDNEPNLNLLLVQFVDVCLDDRGDFRERVKLEFDVAFIPTSPPSSELSPIEPHDYAQEPLDYTEKPEAFKDDSSGDFFELMQLETLVAMPSGNLYKQLVTLWEFSTISVRNMTPPTLPIGFTDVYVPNLTLVKRTVAVALIRHSDLVDKPGRAFPWETSRDLALPWNLPQALHGLAPMWKEHDWTIKDDLPVYELPDLCDGFNWYAMDESDFVVEPCTPDLKRRNAEVIDLDTPSPLDIVPDSLQKTLHGFDFNPPAKAPPDGGFDKELFQSDGKELFQEEEEVQEKLKVFASSKLAHSIALLRQLEKTMTLIERTHLAADLTLDHDAAIIFYPLHLVSQLENGPFPRVFVNARCLELKRWISRVAWTHGTIYVVLESHGDNVYDNVKMCSAGPCAWTGPILEGLQSLVAFSVLVGDSLTIRIQYSHSVDDSLALVDAIVAERRDCMVGKPYVGELWQTRPWINELERLQELWLTATHCFNPFQAQTIMMQGSLSKLISMTMVERLASFGAWVSERSLQRFQYVVHDLQFN